MSSARRDQRSEWQDFLEAVEFFEDITILTEDTADIQNEMDRALGPNAVKAGKLGLCVILMSVIGKPEGDSEFGPLINCLHAAHVIENVQDNRSEVGTGKTREEVTERIAAYSHVNFKPTNGRSPFALVNPGLEIQVEDKYAGFPSETVFFECASMIGRTLDRCATPVLTLDGSNVGITCATTGAAIFYTKNGSAKPTPLHSLYTAPIAVVSGDVIYARAWLAGKLSSVVASLTIP